MKTIERYLNNAGFRKQSEAIYVAENDCDTQMTVNIEVFTFSLSDEQEVTKWSFTTIDNLESFLIANGYVHEDINNINPLY